ncbi:MAG: CRISPR-associated endonuclease Cas1, partial [Anaerolineales bacterium]
MTVLYVTEPYSTIKKDGETLVIHVPADEASKRSAKKVSVPLIKVEEVVIVGDSTLTPQAMAALLDQGVVISFLSPYGQFRGRIEPGERKNSPLRLAQVRVHDDPQRSFRLAKQFVLGKLHNARTLLLRANRRAEDAEIASAAASLREIEDQVEGLESDGAPPEARGKPQAGSALGSLQGLEGAAAARYFSIFGHLLRTDTGLSFDARSRRPPRDPINALLSFGYTLLLHQAIAALQVAGLDPYIGFLHSTQYSKPALALDLMEEFRPIIADSVVLTLINNRVLGREDFIEEFGAWRLKDEARRTFLQKFEERMS